MSIEEQIATLKTGFDLSTEDGRTRCYLSAMLKAISKGSDHIAPALVSILGEELRVTKAAMLHCIQNL